MNATRTTLTEGTYLYGTPEFDLLRRLFDVREEHHSFPNGSAYTSIAPRLFRAEQTVDGHEGVADISASTKYRVVCPDGAEFDAKFAVTRRGPGADLGIHFYSRDDLWDGSSFTLVRLLSFGCPCGERLRTWAPVYPQQRERAICRKCDRRFDAAGEEIRPRSAFDLCETEAEREELRAQFLADAASGGPRPGGPRPGGFGTGTQRPDGAS